MKNGVFERVDGGHQSAPLVLHTSRTQAGWTGRFTLRETPADEAAVTTQVPPSLPPFSIFPPERGKRERGK
jgi:hypothetical protein